MNDNITNIILIVFIIIQTIIMIMSYKKQSSIKKTQLLSAKQPIDNLRDDIDAMGAILWILLTIPITLLFFVVPKLLIDSDAITLFVAIFGVPICLLLPAYFSRVIYEKIREGK